MNKTLVALLTILASAAVHSADVAEYTWLTIGKPSGSLEIGREDDDSTTVHFKFNDRGRGPDTRTTVRLNDDGVPVEITVTGVNYRKGEVNEHFAADDGKASWQSNIEQGESEFDGRAFYLPNNSSPAVSAMLANALLQSANHSLDMLPSGTATVELLDTRVLTGDHPDTEVTLYGISGIDTSPVHIWLDGEMNLFGVDYGWFAITRKGYEKHFQVLKDAQADATDTFFSNASTELTRDIDGELLAIRGARIFDSESGRVTDPSTVFVWDGEISAIYPADVAIPDDALEIDGTGKTLLPTLWDMHGHVSVESYLNYLSAGVTNVRDMANDPDAIEKLGRDVRTGKIMGPDIYALGFIDKRGEFSAPTGILADVQQDALEHVDFYAQRGFHGIKLYSSIEPEWVAPIAAYAHERDLVVMGHVPAYMNAAQAINAGYDEITHINMILLNFLGAEKLDTRTPTRFKVPGEQAGDIDLQSKQVQEFVEIMRSKNIAHDPTLSIFIDMFRNEPGKVSPIFRDIADHLPANARRDSIAGTGFNDGQEAAYARAADRTMQMVKLLHDSGITLLPGTDNRLPGFTLIRELLYYAEAGIPANEVLQIATIVSARHLSQDQRLGSVAVGKEAQVYLVDGDPTQDLANLYRVSHVVKGRQLYFAPDILEKQGFKPFATN